MKCPYCGKELLSNAVRCDGCGAQISNNNQNQNVNSNNQQIDYSQYQNDNKGNKSGILIILVFILLIGVVSYFMFFAGGSSDNSNNEENKENKEKTIENPGTDDNRITSTKKSSYITTAKAYISSVRSEVNMGNKLGFYKQNTLVMVPVGDRSYCGNLEQGDSSPFTKGWNYAYVGVVYDGKGYNYYFISEDDLGNGILFSSYNELDTDKIYIGSSPIITETISNQLKQLYNVSENKEFQDDLPEELKNVLDTKEFNIQKYVFISAKAGCKYR